MYLVTSKWKYHHITATVLDGLHWLCVRHLCLLLASATNVKLKYLPEHVASNRSTFVMVNRWWHEHRSILLHCIVCVSVCLSWSNSSLKALIYIQKLCFWYAGTSLEYLCQLPVNSSHGKLVTPWQVDRFKIVVCDELTAGFVTGWLS